ncbi:MAG TPA: hypothetical protein ENN17_01330 [bacterium]|nr:hypothetical protein [bacterium]
MPRGDGTGPFGQGPGTGRGRGRRGQGPGGGGQRSGSGPEGLCVCPACGARTAHRPGTPCTQVTCPDCGRPMIRGE